MSNEIKPLTEDQKRMIFKSYEEHSTWTLEKTIKEGEKFFRNIVAVPITLIGLICFILSRNIVISLVIIICGLIIGIIAGKLEIRKSKNSVGNVGEIERTEGYTQRWFDEAYNNRQKEGTAREQTVTIGLVYCLCGNYTAALEELKTIDPSIYSRAPSGGHMYYTALLSAYLISGDLDHAADTFNKGFYYLNTYKNSPLYGAHVSLALGMYENFCGHYDVSLQLLDNGMRVHHSDLRPENRLPDENMTSMICYWKAVNFFAMGDKASAWEMINSCKGLYKTPYYEQLSQKLLDDMAKEANHKNVDNIEDLF